MALERKWEVIPPRLFTSNGTTGGEVTVGDTSGFYVKRIVYLKNNVLPNPLAVQVKKVLSPTKLIVGLVDNKIANWMPLDISAFTVASGASIGAEEQVKNNIPGDDHYSAVYEADPVVADRILTVDKYGRPIDSVVDNQGIVRQAVDGQFHAEVDVQVDVDVDGFYDPITNPDPDNIGLIGHERSNPTDQTEQTQRITAKRGTTDTDTVSQDVSIHDHEGNRYDHSNRIPTSSGFERFFQFINLSKWMALGNYDQIVPAYSNSNNTLTLAYKEDGVTIGEAIVNFTSELTWNIQLIRYINDDDGSQLLNDDDSPLNLD